MRTALATVLVLAAVVSPAAAQVDSRWYAGGAAGTSRIEADDVKGSSPTAGAVIGLRLTPGFSVEADVSRGFRRVSRTYEGTSISFAGPAATRAEIERQAVHRRFHNEWSPVVNVAALAVWSATASSRVRPAVFAGITVARYDEVYSSIVTALPEVVPIAADHPNLLPQRQSITRTRGGLTGGFMIPVTIAGALSVAPEIRYTYGSIGDEKHNVFRAGVRVLWGF